VSLLARARRKGISKQVSSASNFGGKPGEHKHYPIVFYHRELAYAVSIKGGVYLHPLFRVNVIPVKCREVLGRVPTSKEIDRVVVRDHTEATAGAGRRALRLGAAPLLGVKMELIKVIKVAFVWTFIRCFNGISAKNVHYMGRGGRTRRRAREDHRAVRAPRGRVLADGPRRIQGARGVDAVHVVRAAAAARGLRRVGADEGPRVGLEVQLVQIIHAVNSVPTAENVHRVADNDSRVRRARGRRLALRHELLPLLGGKVKYHYTVFISVP